MFKNKLLAILASIMTLSVSAQDCEVHLMVAPMSQIAEVPDDINAQLLQRLTAAVSHSNTGIVADSNYDQFFISGRFAEEYADVVPGPPMQNVVNATLTLYIGDAHNEKIFATKTFQLQGVGTSQIRAYINALRTLNGRNNELQKFIDNGRVKIVNYFDNNHEQLLAQAEKALLMKDYEQALYISTSIPTCCVGYNEALKFTLNAYKAYIDNTAKTLLMKARSEWATSPDKEGARAALELLNQIDMDASCYGDAVALQNEIKNTVKENWNFEHREKYKDAIGLEKDRIAAARAVGVAYGNNQKPTTTYINWIR